MASYIYMQNLNEISQIIFSILYVKIKKTLKLNIILLFMGVYGHLNIGHTLNTSYNHMPNLNWIHQPTFEILSGNGKT